jgi:tRNA(fMet)-specific endonuclease VapC
LIFLLDTNTCIQLWQRKNIVVRNNFLALRPDNIALCSVVKAELLFGALRSAHIERNSSLLHKLFEPLHSFDFDDEAASHYAEIRSDLSAKGCLIGANDLLIAAIARANKAVLVTNNTDEFSRVLGLEIQDWEK